MDANAARDSFCALCQDVSKWEAPNSSHAAGDPSRRPTMSPEVQLDPLLGHTNANFRRYRALRICKALRSIVTTSSGVTGPAPVGVIAADTATEVLWDTMTYAKGFFLGTNAVASFAACTNRIGHVLFTLQTDDELASKTHISHGAAERAIQTKRGFTRVCIRVLIEMSSQPCLPRDSPWWAWAVRHATCVQNRFCR